MHQGSCLCGAVSYEIAGDIERITHCHCSLCRKMHGSAFGSYATVPRERFCFTSGEDAVAAYASSPGVLRTFCRHCGSTLQWLGEGVHAGKVSIAAGTLDSPLPPPPQKHIHAGSHASWYRIADGLPRKGG